MKFKEPVKGLDLEIKLVALNDLYLSKYQRQPSPALTNRLVSSLDVGFIDPLLITPSLEVIDGQHRIEALKKILSGDALIPCVVVPETLRHRPLAWNIEKVDNIKDISQKLYYLYMDVSEWPESTEKNIGAASLYTPSYITLAFSFMENNLGSPSLVQGAVKKLDKEFFIQTPLTEAVDIRRSMAMKARNLEDCVYETAEEWRINDFNLKKALITKSSQAIWGRKTKLEETFDEGMEKLIEEIRDGNWSWMAGR